MELRNHRPWQAPCKALGHTLQCNSKQVVNNSDGGRHAYISPGHDHWGEACSDCVECTYFWSMGTHNGFACQEGRA